MNSGKLDKMMQKGAIVAFILVFISALIFVAQNSELVNLIKNTF